MNNPNPSANGHLSVAQAARALNMSERTLRRHIALGKIEASRGSSPSNGSAWFVPRATVEALLASGRKPMSADEEKEDVPDALPAPCDEQEMPANLALLLKRVEELAACCVALEGRVAQLERELELLTEPATASSSGVAPVLPAQGVEVREREPSWQPLFLWAVRGSSTAPVKP